MKPAPRILLFAMLSTFSSLGMAGVTADMDSLPQHGADRSDKDWNGMLGLAVLSSPEYISGDDTETTGAPVIIVDYKDTAYFKINRGGFWFWKPDDNFRMGALVKLRAGAWEDDDDSIEDLNLPSSFDEPDMQAEPGVNLLYRVDKFEAELQLLAGEDTNIAANLDYRAYQTDTSTITLRLEIESLGEDTVNYNWYGDISSLDTDSATNVSLAVIGTYRFNEKWSLLYGAKTTSLDDEIEDSPIGDEDTYTVGFVGATWSF